MSLSLGDLAPDFLLPTTDGGTASLADLDGPTAVVIAFWCNHCPYVQAWEERFNAIARDYGPRGVATIAICANDAVTHPGDSLEAMTLRAAEREYDFPYARDDGQGVPRAYGAERTPEIFVLDDRLRLAYHGAIDDSSDAERVTEHFLRSALDAVIEGRAPERASTPPVGCTIKWTR